MAARTLIPMEYNDFLFATIGEERNETPLSVLSALTRLDKDPWQEAARFAQQPKHKAIQNISSTLGTLPGRRWTPSESNEIAARLVELLPSRKNNSSSHAEDRLGRRIAIALTLMWIVFAGAWMTFVVETSHPSPPPIEAANTIAN